MTQVTDGFAFLLVRASQKTGSLLAVAALLGVAPHQVYRWIADVDQPSNDRRCELEARLQSIIATPLPG